MARSMCSAGRWLLPAVLGVFLASPALGVIVHPGVGQPSDTPHNDVIGKWILAGDTEQTASCVAISPDWVITTRHQAGAVGTKVVLGGVEYQVAEIVPHSSHDIRLARVTKNGQPANLQHYVDLYTGTNETALPLVTIGGYGRLRGATLNDGSMDYGYAWGAVPTGNTPTWGTNVIDGTGTLASGPFKGTAYLWGDFDDPGTTYEAGIAIKDSGGGWFTKDTGGEWWLIALGQGVQRIDETWFDDPGTGRVVDPDIFSGVRVSTYAGWAQSIVPEPATLGLFALGGWFLLGRRHHKP